MFLKGVSYVYEHCIYLIINIVKFDLVFYFHISHDPSEIILIC